MGLNHENTEGRKARETLPLISQTTQLHICVTYHSKDTIHNVTSKRIIKKCQHQYFVNNISRQCQQIISRFHKEDIKK